MSKPIRSKTEVFEYILQENNPNATTDFVLLHGFGADCGDLFGLYPYLKNLNVRRFIFPDGIIPANSVPSGRAWFPIDIEALEKAMMTGSHRDMGGAIPPAVNKLSKSIEDSLINELGIDPNNCIIGGFSQGSMMAMNMALNTKSNYKAVVQLSGTFLDRTNWSNLIQNRPKFPVFMSHGENDALLNPKDADELGHLLYKNEYPIEFIPFKGGHEIPLEVLEKLNGFLQKIL